MPLYEKVDDRVSPSVSSFSVRNQTANYTAIVSADDPDIGVATLLPGACESDGLGGLKRTLPVAHPEYPWMFCDKADIVGMGKWTEEISDASYASIGADPVSEVYAYYEEYAIHCTFSSRPYAVIPDEKVPPSTITWTDVGNVSVTSPVSQEYRRFTYIQKVPRAEVITATQGQMVFRSPVTPPNKTTYPGRPQLRLPGAKVDIHFLEVPYQWVLSPDSWISYLQGRINQTAFLGFPPGTLLYESCSVTPYSPPNPAIDDEIGDGVYTADLLCDIVFHCWEAIRTQSADKLPLDSDIIDKNWIAAGHNLMPFARDRQFYYASSAGSGINEDSSTADASDLANKNKWQPTFNSAPFQLLFTDPDVFVEEE